MKRLAIIGCPVSHSLSPQMHNYISERMGLDYGYEAIEVLPKDLGNAVMHLKEEGYSGYNVTAPHKFEVMQYLDEISGDAKIYGAVNTVVNRDGKLYGYNTDAEGFYRSLLHSGINPQNMDILILGAGGAAQPVTMRLSNVAKSVTVSNRTAEKSKKIAENTKAYNGFFVETEITRKSYDLIINCTTLGMESSIDKTPLADLSLVGGSVVDMIYNPSETTLLKECKNIGAKTVNGLGMLIYQGILAYELFTGVELPGFMADELFKIIDN